MWESGKTAEEGSSVPVHPGTAGFLSAPPGSHSPSNVSDCTAVPDSTPCSPLRVSRTVVSVDSQLTEAQVTPEKALQQTVIIVEEEPALVHTRQVLLCCAPGVPERPGNVLMWSPATPELAELVPIGTTPSQRESVVTHETEASPHSPFDSHRGSPRPENTASAARVSTAPGDSVPNPPLERGMLSFQSSLCLNSPPAGSALNTPSSSSSQRRARRGPCAERDAPRVVFTAGDWDNDPPQSLAVAPPSPFSDSHSCATAAPTQLRTLLFEPRRHPSPTADLASDMGSVSAHRASLPNTASLSSLLVHTKGGDGGSRTPPTAPLSLHATRAARTNASGGAVPTVPAIRLPVEHTSSGMESDRSTSMMGYGPRSAPNACSIVSARSGRSSRSARHSHRCGASLRTTLPSLKELFPTLPQEMYVARERLCVAQDNVGRLGTGAYGTVQRAELYPPEIEVPRFFTPVAETCTNPSIPNTPRFSPANALFSSHNFASIASAVNGAEGGPAREPSSVFLHSRLDSAVSTDSVSALPIHQQPYSNQTASFYNGLDDVLGMTGTESASEAHWPGRGQSPEVESVILCGQLAVNTDSGETSAPTTRSTKGLPGAHSSHGSLSALPDQQQQQQQGEEVSLPTSSTSRCLSQRFPDLPVVLVGRVKSSEVGGFSLTSPQISRAHLVAGELDLEAEDNTVRMSAGDDEVGRLFSDPLQDTEGSAEDAEVSRTSTAGTRRFLSSATQQWDNKTCLFSARTTHSNVHDGREEGEEDDSRHCAGNSTTLPAQLVADGDAALNVDGDVGESLPLAASRCSTKQQQQRQLSEVFCASHKSEVPLLLHTDPMVIDAARRTTNVYHEAALRLPLVLPRTRGPNGSSASFHTSESTPESSGRHEASAVFAVAAEELPAAQTDVAVVAAEHDEKTDAPAEDDGVLDGDKKHCMSGFCLADGRDLSFLASATFPELQESRGRVGDDTLTSTAQQAVARAVLEACEEYEDAYAEQHGDTAAADTGRDAHSVENVEDGSLSARVRRATQTAPAHSSTAPTSSNCAAAVGHPSTAASAIVCGAEGRHVEQVSPTSTISSLFSGGVTNMTTRRTSQQNSVGAAAAAATAPASTNPLQTSHNTPETPLLRYGVNSTMVLEAVSNGCAPFRPVAVKVVEKFNLAENALKLNAFHNELRMASRLNHPCLVNVFGVAEDAENFYLVMDMAEKGTLAQYQQEFGVADTRTMAPRFLADVVLALEYLQDGSQHTYWMTAKAAATPANATGEDRAGSGEAPRFGAESASPPSSADTAPSHEGQGQLLRESVVLHRDVKPDNLLLTWDFHVKLTDFGDACFYGDEEANCFGGTSSYLSPEVIVSSKASLCSDLWALGCILYELLVGEKLFTGSLREVANSIQAFDADALVFPTSPRTALDDLGCDEDESGCSGSVAGSRATISEAAKDLVRQLLRRVPEERIGSPERGGFATLRQHPFFAEIAWDSVLETTNMTTVNTDYTAELADYLGAEEHVVYCSPVKVLPTSEPQTRTSPTQLSAQGSLVMVLTDAPRLFLVNPDTDTVQFCLPWSSELRVGVLRADRFTITVPISDVLVPPSTPAATLNNGASLSLVSRTSSSAAATITYAFLDTNRRADLWGVTIHHLQSLCPGRREVERSTPTFPSRQSSATQPASNTSGVPPLHWPQQGRRGTPTLSPRAGGCLLHRLRTTPRSARAGSLSSHAVSFAESTAAAQEGRGRRASHVRSFSEVCGGEGTVYMVAPSAAAPGTSATSLPKPTTRCSKPIRLPTTAFLASSAPSSTLVGPAANGKAGTTLTSPGGISSDGSFVELRSPECVATVGSAAVVPVHRRVNTMTVTIASSSHSQLVYRGRVCSLGHTPHEGHAGVSPVDFEATMADSWAKAAGEVTDVSPSSATGTSELGGSLCDDILGFSSSTGVVTPRILRDDAARPLARDTQSQSEATPGLSSAQRHVDQEPEMGGSFPSLWSARCDAESDGARASYTPLRSTSFSGMGGTAAAAPLKEKMSKARQQFQLTQRRKTQA